MRKDEWKEELCEFDLALDSRLNIRHENDKS